MAAAAVVGQQAGDTAVCLDRRRREKGQHQVEREEKINNRDKNMRITNREAKPFQSSDSWRLT